MSEALVADKAMAHRRCPDDERPDTVNHNETIAILLRVMTTGRTGDRPFSQEQRQAEEHIAQCSDCWEVLSKLYTQATGGPPLEAERMRALYGCERIQDQMWLLTGLSPRDIEAQYPDIVRHLGWCHACRDRLVEIVRVARAAARGEFEPPVIAPATPRWEEKAGTRGETMRELVGRVLGHIRSGVAALTFVPERLAWDPLRGSLPAAPESREPALGQRVLFALADSGLSAELTLHAHGSERGQVEVHIAGPSQGGLSVRLRAVQAERTELVGSQPVRGAAPVVFRNLRPGQYVLEIHERARRWGFQITFNIEIEP